MAYPNNMLRIRDNGTVKELNIPRDKLEVLQKIVASKTIAEKTKHLLMRKLTEGSPCSICGAIHTHEIRYTGEGGTVIERYCSKCIERVYSREQVL
jgi:hypothetical protein